MATALAVGEAFVTTLPPGLLTTARWAELLTAPSLLPVTRLSKLQAEYLLRSGSFGNGQLLVAMPRARVLPLHNALLRQSVGLALVVTLLTLAVVMWQAGRILSPLAKLTRAAELVGRGQLARSRPLVSEFAERRDEIGALARAQLSATGRLHTVVTASQRLAHQIAANVDTVDGVAKTVATGAARQEDRLSEVTGTLEPLTRALVHTSQGLHDAHNIVTTLALSSSAADQTQAILATAVRRAEALLNTKEKENVEPRAVRTASVLQQAGVIAQAVTDQREVFLKVRECVLQLRNCIDAALESQLMEQHHGQHVHRATTEIGRLSKLHAHDAAALRASSELLRTDLLELQKQLDSLDSRSSEEARLTGEERLSPAERAELDAARRRPDRLRSSQSLQVQLRRSLPGVTSSQGLSPVPAPAAERRAVPASANSAGLPLSRSSGNFPKVSGPTEPVPSGASLRSGYASSISGGGVVTAKGPSSGSSLGGGAGNARALPSSVRSLGPTSSTSLNGSSGNIRPVPGSHRSLGPASGTSLSGSSGNIRPVPGSHRSLGPTSGTSINGSSGNVRPVPGPQPSGPHRLPAPGGGEEGASARSLRPDGPSFPSASAQSLTSGLSGRPAATRSLRSRE